MWAPLVAAVLGIWLMCAPAVLDYRGLPADHDHIAGPLIATFALVAAFEITRSLRWCNVVIGAWLLIAPWLLGYSEGNTQWNSVATGAAIVAVSVVRGRRKHRYADGWRTLLR